MNAAVRRFGSVIVLVQNEDTPTDAEWDEFLKLMSTSADKSKLKILVETPGGSPSPGQRKRLAEMFGGKSPFKVAVLSDSVKVRFVHVTIALFYKYLRLFSTKEIQSAYDHLELTTAERQMAAAALNELRANVRASAASG